MSERASVFEITQIGPEATPGTAVPATRKLLGTTIVPSIRSENREFRARGSRWTTVAIQNKEWGVASITQDIASYTDTAYLLASLLGMPHITTPGGGTISREQTYEPPSFSVIVPKTFTVESGSAKRAHRMAHGIVTELGMQFDRDGVSLSGSMLGKKIEDGITLTPGTNEVQTLSASGTVTGGTYKLTFRGETTGTIAHNANAATIQTAINALPNVESGDITVGGGPLPGTDTTFTYGGRYASQDMPLIQVESSALTGGGSYVMTETTPGAPLTELAPAPIAGSHWAFYLDNAEGDYGTTEYLRVLSASWRITDMFGPLWLASSTEPSWATHVDMPPTTEVRFRLEADAVGMGLRSRLQDGDTAFIRIQALGNIIEGSIKEMARFDLATKITGVSDYTDEDGIVAIEWSGVLSHKSGTARAMRVVLRNTIAAIA